MAITDALIPVAGLGTRLLPATRSQPKEMLPLVDKPAVEYIVDELAVAGIKRILFVTGRRKRAIEDHFDVDPQLDRAVGPSAAPGKGLQILYTRQSHPAGLGDALRRGEGFAGDRGLVVALGDAIIQPRPGGSKGIVERLIDAYEAHNANAVLAVQEVPSDQVSRYGIAIPDGAATGSGPFELADVVEKPDPSEVSSRTAAVGRYVFGPAVFTALRETSPDVSGEVQIADALRQVLAAGGRVLAVPLAAGERRHDLGTIESYCAAFLEHALSHPRLGPALRVRAAELLRGER